MAEPAGVSKTAFDKPDPDIVSLIPALRAFGRTFCRDSTNADDLVQETLTRAIAAIDRFEPGTNRRIPARLLVCSTRSRACRSRRRRRAADRAASGSPDAVPAPGSTTP